MAPSSATPRTVPSVDPAAARDCRAAHDHGGDDLQLEACARRAGAPRRTARHSARQPARQASAHGKRRPSSSSDGDKPASRADSGRLPDRVSARPAARCRSTQPASAISTSVAPMISGFAGGLSRPNHWKAAGRSRTHAPSVAQRRPSRSTTSIASDDDNRRQAQATDEDARSPVRSSRRAARRARLPAARARRPSPARRARRRRRRTRRQPTRRPGP